MSYEVKVQNLQRQAAAVIRFKCPPGEAARFIGPAYGEIGGYLHDSGIEHEDTAVYARFLSFGAEQEVEAGFTVATPVPPKGRVEPGELPAGEAAMTTHVGPYDGLVAASQALRDWMSANGREPAGGPWEVYRDDPQTTAIAQLRTEVYYPLKPLA